VNQASRSSRGRASRCIGSFAQIVRKQIDRRATSPATPCRPKSRMATSVGSLITVREARRALVREGLICATPGRGTFVAQKPSLITYRIASTTADVYAFNGGLENTHAERDIPSASTSKRLVSRQPRNCRAPQAPSENEAG